MSDGLLERLRNGCILRQRRWSRGVCEGWPVDEAATDALMAEAADEIERLRREVDEQCRLNSIGSEREARLLTINRQLEAEYAAQRGRLAARLKGREPRKDVEDFDF